MKNWLLAVDHKQLIPILSTKELLLIPNPRIANQQVKMLPFSFTPVHIPGKTNVIPDTSRAAPENHALQSEPTIPIQDVLEVQPGYSDTYGPPWWVVQPTGAGMRTSKLTEDGTEAYVLGLAWAQVAATQELEKEVVASHGLGGVRAVTWDVLQVETA